MRSPAATISKAVEYSDLRNGVTHNVKVDALLIRIGVVPNTELFREKLDLDPRGYIRVAHTSKPPSCAFAVGDVASPQSPTIATAVGMGASAVKIFCPRLDFFR
jgi:thioredoxin reductase (NADPH)